MYTSGGVNLAHIALYFTERRTVVVKTVTSFAGDRGFESRRSDWISLWRLVVIFPPDPSADTEIVPYSSPQLLRSTSFPIYDSVLSYDVIV
jgi:hypothetical protein